MNHNDKVFLYYASTNADKLIIAAENAQRQAEIAAKGAAGADGL